MSSAMEYRAGCLQDEGARRQASAVYIYKRTDRGPVVKPF